MANDGWMNASFLNYTDARLFRVEIGGREIGGNPAHGILAPGVSDRGPDMLFGLLDPLSGSPTIFNV